MWRKTCTGLKFDLVYFNGPQTKFKNIDNFGGPCRYTGQPRLGVLDSRPVQPRQAAQRPPLRQHLHRLQVREAPSAARHHQH